MYLQCMLQLSLYVAQLKRLINFRKITEPALQKFVLFVQNSFKFCRDRFLIFLIVAHVDKASFDCSAFCTRYGQKVISTFLVCAKTATVRGNIHSL